MWQRKTLLPVLHRWSKACVPYHPALMRAKRELQASPFNLWQLHISNIVYKQKACYSPILLRKEDLVTVSTQKEVSRYPLRDVASQMFLTGCSGT